MTELEIYYNNKQIKNTKILKPSKPQIEEKIKIIH